MKLPWLIILTTFGFLLWASAGCKPLDQQATEANRALRQETARIQFNSQQAAQAFANLKAFAVTLGHRVALFRAAPEANPLPDADELADLAGDIDEQATAGLKATGEIDRSVPRANAAADRQEQITHRAVKQVEDIKHSLPYRIGWWLCFAAVAWAVAGLGGMLLRGFFPVGGLGYLAEHLLDFLPLSNVFYAGSDRIRSARAASPVTKGPS